jgi:hypothetical protein
VVSPDAVEAVVEADGDGDSPGNIGCHVAMSIAPMIATATMTDSGTERRGGRAGGVLGDWPGGEAPGSGVGPPSGVGILIVGLSSDMWATVYERTRSTLVGARSRRPTRCACAPPDAVRTLVGGDSWHRGVHPWGATVSGRQTPRIVGVARSVLTAGHPTP